MSTAIQKTELLSFTPEQVDLIRSQIAPKATPDELKLFLYQAARTGLDPLARQIYCIHRNVSEKVNGQWVKVPKMTIQTSIDGFRVVAERSGSYAGQSEPEFVYSESNGLIVAKVRVFRFGPGGQRYEAAVGVAHWMEYAQTDNNGAPSGQWGKMPHVMLSKVAEALALRKAFPQDLSGLYTSEEMQQADVAQTVDAPHEEVKAYPKDLPAPLENYSPGSIDTAEDGEREAPIHQQWLDDCLGKIEQCSSRKMLRQYFDANVDVANAHGELLDAFKAHQMVLLTKETAQPA